MTNKDIIKAAYNCAEHRSCSNECRLRNCDNCAETFATYIVAKDLESEEKPEDASISDLPDYPEDVDGLAILEYFEGIVQDIGGKVTSVNADGGSAILRYEMNGSPFYLSYGGD